MSPARGYLLLVPLVFLVPPTSSPGEPPPAKEGKPGATKRIPLTDRYGDPLPEGAVARMGSLALRHPGEVRSVLFSPDGKRLISEVPGSRDENSAPRIYVWETATFKQIGRFTLPGVAHLRGAGIDQLAGCGGGMGGGAGLGGLQGGGTDAAVRNESGGAVLAISSRGPTVASRGPDGSVLLWDLTTRKKVRRLQAAEEQASPDAFAFSPDGKTVARGGAEIELWDAAAGKRLRRFGPEDSRVLSLTFSPDGKWLASASNSYEVHLWSVPGGKAVREFPGGDNARVAFSPDGKTLATDDEEDAVHLWDVKSGKHLRVLRGPKAAIQALAFSPGGRLLASADGAGMVCAWDVSSGKKVHRFEADSVTANAVAFAPDGRTLATGGADRVVKLWDVTTGKEVRPRPAHRDAVLGMAYSPDGRRLASGDREGTVRVWEAASGKPLRVFRGFAEGVRCLAIFPGGKALVAVGSGDGDGPLVCWDLTTGARRWTTVATEEPITSITVTPDGRRVISLGPDGPARFWDAATGKELPDEGRRKIKNRETPDVLSPDGRWEACLAGPEEEAVVRVRETATGKKLWERKAGPFRYWCLFFSPDGRSLGGLTHADGVQVSIWEVTTGDPAGQVVVRQEDDSDLLVAFSPDQRYLATAGTDLPLQIWEVASGQVVGRFEPPYAVNALAFAPDGRSLVTGGGGDYALLVWDLTGRARQGARPAARLSRGELGAAWADLAGTDGPRAYRAVWALAFDPELSVPFLRRRLRPVAPADPGQVARLIADLDNPKFAVRRAAARRLAGLEEAAAPALRQALAGRPPLETRLRLELLRKRLNPWGSAPERLRALRAVAALEQAGTPGAKAFLRELARGIPGARLTREARAALERLARRPPAGGRLTAAGR